MYLHNFFILSSADEHLGYFHVLAIVNNAAVNMRVQVSFQVSVFVSLDRHPELELWAHLVVIFLIIH